MDKLNLTTKSRVQLAILQAEEQQHIKNISNLLSKVDKICKEESGMSLADLIECYDDRLDRLDAINTEIELLKEIESL